MGYLLLLSCPCGSALTYSVYLVWLTLLLCVPTYFMLGLARSVDQFAFFCFASWTTYFAAIAVVSFAT